MNSLFFIVFSLFAFNEKFVLKKSFQFDWEPYFFESVFV